MNIRYVFYPLSVLLFVMFVGSFVAVAFANVYQPPAPLCKIQAVVLLVNQEYHDDSGEVFLTILSDLQACAGLDDRVLKRVKVARGSLHLLSAGTVFKGSLLSAEQCPSAGVGNPICYQEYAISDIEVVLASATVIFVLLAGILGITMIVRKVVKAHR